MGEEEEASARERAAYVKSEMRPQHCVPPPCVESLAVDAEPVGARSEIQWTAGTVACAPKLVSFSRLRNFGATHRNRSNGSTVPTRRSPALSLQQGACRRSSGPTPPLICALALLRCAECWHFSRGENPREPS